MILEHLQNGTLSVPDIWQAYLAGVEYNDQISLVDTVEENNNMYIGRQWEGIEIEGLPTIALNFIKPVTQYKVASITSTRTKITVQPVSLLGAQSADQKLVAEIVNQQLDKLCEREQLENLLLTLETNTAVDGDGCWHLYWDPAAKTGQAQDGDMAVENIKNVNVYFGNTAESAVQEQPFIIVERREYISSLKTYARDLGLDEMEVAAIVPDRDSQYSVLNDDNRVTVLTFYWRDAPSKTIRQIECTQTALLQPETDTGLALYPICWQNWEPRLNSYHGEACVSELVTNQITINKLATMNAVSLSRTAFPTILYNKSLLPEGWDNSVGAAIGVEDMQNMHPSDVAGVINGAVTNSQVEGFFTELMQMTKNLNGASDATLGSIDPTNTSAILALQKTAMVPLELNKRRLYTFLEDFARVALDFMANYYGRRTVAYTNPQTGREDTMLFDFNLLQGAAFRVKIDVGPSSYWSELTEMQQLEKLVQMGVIGGMEYLRYMPDGLFAGRQDLLNKLKAEARQQEFEGQQSALQSMLAKSPELSAKLQQLKQNDPQGYDQAVKSLYAKIQRD